MKLPSMLRLASPLSRLVFAGLILLICWLAFSPHPPQSANLGWDKANHASAFMTLMLCAAWAWPQRLLWAVPGLVAYGGFIEIVQSFIPERDGEWLDLFADSVGIAIGLALVHLARRLLHRRFTMQR